MKKIEYSDIRSLLETTFPNSDMSDRIDLMKMGDIQEWDSVGNFNLLLAAEDFYGVRFNMEQMSQIKSVLELIDALKKLS
jgi:acyl carrier protein